MDGKVLVIRSIHVTYHLRIDPEKLSVAERLLGVHVDHCPVARTLKGCVEITTALKLEP